MEATAFGGGVIPQCYSAGTPGRLFTGFEPQIYRSWYTARPEKKPAVAGTYVREWVSCYSASAGLERKTRGYTLR